MSRLTGFNDLAGKRVGLFGYGVEGRAARARLEGVADLVVVDDNPIPGDDVLATARGGLAALASCEVILKSPGIPRRREDVLDLERRGALITSALNLWLHEVERERVIAITGTKGKSTTTALVTFFLQCVGETAMSVGNIGRPPYDPGLNTSSGWLVLEVSSFQSLDLDVAPAVVVVTSLGSDHLDWHGSVEQYRSDKLTLTRADGEHVTFLGDSATLREARDQIGGEVRVVGYDHGTLTSELGLLGEHNRANVALALAVTSAVTGRRSIDVRRAVAKRATDFVPLRGRLSLVATEQLQGRARRFVDDGLATSVLPTVAALEVFVEEPLALIAGGFDRGVDYSELAEVLGARDQPTTALLLGNAGLRLETALVARGEGVPHHLVASMREAVTRARAALSEGGVVLLSPAAPSFDLYHNWEERSNDFITIVRELLDTP